MSEILCFGNLQGFPITESPAARGGGVYLFAGDVTHHTDLREVFPIERNRNSIKRITMDKICGPVQGIDYPKVI